MVLKEPTLNDAISEVLNGMFSGWSAQSEQGRQLRDAPGKTPDILIRTDGRQTVVVENEVYPAAKVEEEATSRLGQVLASNERIEIAVALVSPEALRKCESAAKARAMIRSRDDFQYAVHYLSGERFPDGNAYISGTLRDLGLFIHNASVPADSLTAAIEILDHGVLAGLEILRDVVESNQRVRRRYATLLKQDLADDTLAQALGMAATIMLNAFVFQQQLANYHDIRNLSQMDADDDLTQRGVLGEWQAVLDINYWSIFNLAKDLLYAIQQPQKATHLVRTLAHSAGRLYETGVSQSHDLAGVVFQRFITQRKYLATFYTRPESATLLTHLAIRDDGRWDSAARYKAFKAADYACGTGTLIHAVYLRIALLHELSGGKPSHIHKYMMQEAMTAADIVPSAVHLTASMLSSVFPSQVYADTRVIIPQYGEVRRQVRLGSLELLSKEARLRTLFDLDTGTKSTGTGATGSTFARDMPPKSQDLVIMNPPYTRAMSDWEAGAEGTWKQYRAFGTTKEAQERMKQRERDLGQGTCYTGYQAMPSAFCAVANHMVRDGGTIGLVLPLTSAQGISWLNFRRMLATDYSDVVVISIAGSDGGDQAWSSDTNMAEVLVLATKRKSGRRRGYMVSLRERPKTPMLAIECAREIASTLDANRVRTVLDGPYGGTPIRIGTIIGSIVEQELTDKPWSALCFLDGVTVQVAEQLNRGRIWLPRRAKSENCSIPVRPLGKIARIGPAANNIGKNATRAFSRIPVTDSPTYPMLWSILSEQQTRMIVPPDQEGIVRKGKEKRAQSIWEYRSHAHMSCGTRFTSQRLLMAYTDERTIGGEWTSVQAETEDQEKVLTLWGNSTLGLLQYWYHGSRQQLGRAFMPVRSMATLPFLDVTALDPGQLSVGAQIFDDLKDSELRRLMEAGGDPVRQEIDRRLLTEVLGVPSSQMADLAVLRKKLCAEPTINAGRVPAPEGQSAVPTDLPRAAERTGTYRGQEIDIE